LFVELDFGFGGLGGGDQHEGEEGWSHGDWGGFFSVVLWRRRLR
jgi:hypothetical protein